MYNLTRAFLILTFLLTAGTARAQMTCVEAFETRVLAQLSSADIARLAKQQFRINEQNELIDTRTNQRVATAVVVESKYLYEWASHEEHQYWLRKKGLPKADMDYILESAPQGMGKGYYVSMDPFNSQNYGPALTIFETTKPLLVLEYLSFYGNVGSFGKTELVKRLKRAGVDGTYAKGINWLALYNEEQLRIARAPIQDPQFNIIYDQFRDNESARHTLAQALVDSGVMDLLSDDTLFKKKYQKTLRATRAPRGDDKVPFDF